MQFDLPGVEVSSIDLTVEKNVLTVHAQRQRSSDDGTELLVAERPHGTFSRQLFLGETLDTDRIDAAYANGVLTLRVPVAERAKPRRVTIASGDGCRRSRSRPGPRSRSGPGSEPACTRSTTSTRLGSPSGRWRRSSMCSPRSSGASTPNGSCNRHGPTAANAATAGLTSIRCNGWRRWPTTGMTLVGIRRIFELELELEEVRAQLARAKARLRRREDHA